MRRNLQSPDTLYGYSRFPRSLAGSAFVPSVSVRYVYTRSRPYLKQQNVRKHVCLIKRVFDVRVLGTLKVHLPAYRSDRHIRCREVRLTYFFFYPLLSISQHYRVIFVLFSYRVLLRPSVGGPVIIATIRANPRLRYVGQR